MITQDIENILDMVSAEFDWPPPHRALLAWYYNRLGANRFLAVWQEQSYANESRPPRSKYRAFRARLSKSITPTP